jgi:hypothetical protein
MLDGDQSANTWTLRSFTLEDYIPLTSTMKIRFGASDAAPDGDYVEAAIDLVLVLLPEACETPAVAAEGSRTVGVTPGPSAQSVALLATGDPGDPSVSCVSAYVQGDGTLDVEPVYQTPGAWNRVHVRDLAIVPEATYEVRADCQIDGNPVLSSTASATTWLWSDVDDSGLVNIGDVLFLVEAFQGNFSHVTLEAADLDPCEPNGMINIGDVLMAVRAFTGDTYMDMLCPMPCP